MLNTIDDLIHYLEAMKKINTGGMFIRTETQIGKIIEVDTKVERFYNDDKTSHIDVLIIIGYLKNAQTT